MVLHTLKHLRHVEEAQLAAIVLLQCVKLPGRDLVAFNGVLLGMECAHVLDKAARDRGRQFYWVIPILTLIDRYRPNRGARLT